MDYQSCLAKPMQLREFLQYEWFDRKLIELICDASEMMVAGDDPALRILAQQWSLAKCHLEEGNLELTGVGFYYWYSIPEPCPLISLDRFVLHDIAGSIFYDDKEDALFVNLFVEQGKLYVLEGATIDDWPEKLRAYTMRYSRATADGRRDVRALKKSHEDENRLWPTPR